MDDATYDPPDDQTSRLRRIVSDAYAFIRGRETTSSFAAITFEDLAQKQLERLSGAGTASRPNELTRIRNIEAELINVAEQIKQTPPEAFLPPDEEKDVNTPA